MLNKAIKELMSETGTQANVLCVAMGQSESTFSRMFMKDDSDPKSSSIALLARRLNIKVSDVYLKAEILAPVMCRYFYSAEQDSTLGIDSECLPHATRKSFVYINDIWHHFTEKTSLTGSSNFRDALYLGEAPRWHTKRYGKVRCPDLYKQLCDEAKEKQSK